MTSIVLSNLYSPLPYVRMYVVVDFFNRVNLMYGTISEYCTEKSCPTMSGGPKYEYYWSDGDRYKKPTGLPATTVSAFTWLFYSNSIGKEHVLILGTVLLV